MTGIEMIALERRHQEGQGFTATVDDEHVRAELAIQSASLVLAGTACYMRNPYFSEYGDGDGWGLSQKYGLDRMRQLAGAGALIAAEIDRLQRSAERKTTHGKAA